MQVDESLVPVSDPDTPGANARGWWWTYSNPRGSVSYEFARTRGYVAAVDRLNHYNGKIQTDSLPSSKLAKACADVLPRLANGTTSEVPSLTPAAWLRHRSGQPAA